MTDADEGKLIFWPTCQLPMQLSVQRVGHPRGGSGFHGNWCIRST